MRQIMNDEVKEAIARALENAEDDDDLAAIFYGIESGFDDTKEHREFAYAVFTLYGDCSSLGFTARAVLTAKELVKNDLVIPAPRNESAVMPTPPAGTGFTAKAAREWAKKQKSKAANV